MDMDQSMGPDSDMDITSDENSNSKELDKLIKEPELFKKFETIRDFDKMSLNEDKTPDANNILEQSKSASTSCHSVLSQRITRASIRRNMALMFTPSKSKGRLGVFKTPTPSLDSLLKVKQSFGPHTYSRSQIRAQLLEYKKNLNTDNTPVSAEKPLNSRRANWTPKSLFKSLDFEQNIIGSGKKETQFNK